MLIPGLFTLGEMPTLSHTVWKSHGDRYCLCFGGDNVLKSRVPMALKVFLVTLAVVDDLGAIVVIALFYTSTLNYAYLGLAAVLICVLLRLISVALER